MDGITLYSELVRQAPGLAALVAVVVVFLRAQAARDSMFLSALDIRDKLWAAMIEKLSEEVGQNSQIVTAHDAAMKVTAGNLLREKKRTKNNQ